jgi:phosphate:Na+ symporter
MNIEVLSGLIGGIGLFLLGMRLMTEGFKMAAGRALHDIIQRSTGTVLRGLLSGALITSLVQSSSAVTVAIIGFVNAGLMSLAQAVILIYGSAVGTTMTGWLVALVGFKLNINIFALPLIGLGMLTRLAAGERRLGALGEALTGFGLFFLGINMLRVAFEGLGDIVQLASLDGNGQAGLLFFAGIGLLFTFLMQSSSAAIAIIITAAGGGVVPLPGAAAMVIGANVGTTITAVLAALGATPNAKRVAASYVCFKAIIGLIAIGLLPFFFFRMVAIMAFAGMDTSPPVILALFHTALNVGGVALMLPFTGRLVGYLGTFFRNAEEDEARPRYLDRAVAATPVMAIQALTMELTRVGEIARRMARGAISSENGSNPDLAVDKRVLHSLVDAAGKFSSQVQHSHLSEEVASILPNGLRVSGYYAIMAELAVEVAREQASLGGLDDPEAAAAVASFKRTAIRLLDGTEPLVVEEAAGRTEAAMGQLKEEYRQVKALLLRAGIRGQLSARQLVGHFELISTIRRIVEEEIKAVRYLGELTAYPARHAIPGEGAQPAQERSPTAS